MDFNWSGVLARATPRRNVTLLRTESLINDGTALVIYGLAVGVTVGEEHFSLPHNSWLPPVTSIEQERQLTARWRGFAPSWATKRGCGPPHSHHFCLGV